MAYQQVTGPAFMYVAYPGINAPIFLGTDERCPRIQHVRYASPVPNDLAGDVPFDRLCHGQEAVLVTDLNRFNQLALSRMFVTPGKLTGTQTVGLQTRLDVGTLVGQEGANFIFYVVFPFSGNSVIGQLSGMPPGYRFLSCLWISPTSEEELGTRVRKIRCVIQAQRVYFPETGTFALYDHDIPTLPLPD